jgi:hypothetical protein
VNYVTRLWLCGAYDPNGLPHEGDRDMTSKIGTIFAMQTIALIITLSGHSSSWAASNQFRRDVPDSRYETIYSPDWCTDKVQKCCQC